MPVPEDPADGGFLLVQLLHAQHHQLHVLPPDVFVYDTNNGGLGRRRWTHQVESKQQGQREDYL